MEIRDKYYTVNGIRLHVAEAGNPEGPVLLFLHGFPEFWYGWRKQLGFFAAKGFWVLAPDQRGYNTSSKPSGVKAYTISQLTTDIADLIQQVISRKVYLVGHDWGGAVAWAVAQHYPNLLEKLIILNMPHPEVMHQELRTNPKQLLMSWYTGFFQLPMLPEAYCRAFNFKALEKSMMLTANEGTFSKAEIKCYKVAWQQPQALTTMINWYRAYKYKTLYVSREVTVPTLMLWGRKDTFLSDTMAQPSIAKCTNGQLVFMDNATHWLHHEKPDEVNSFIYEFIK
ncbi:alpha/beta fold hydrolase [Pontibacter pamirensis]|uniref:alpha/beta fold hydrolase n=1 Tax=Pontibacter pamirensis TaxID=2562824 RepID=UPI00138A08A8|nr:alpha/beta hydrolase [Pontibacter pamirensis]